MPETPQKMRITQVIGWIPDLPDHRDYSYRMLRPQSRLRKAIARPRSQYMREDNLPRLYDQSIIGSCVGHGCTEGAAYAVDYNSAPLDGRKPRDYSRLYAYWNARRNKDKDEGAFIREGIKGIAQFGICTEELWPYDTSKWAVKPPDEAFADGQTRKAVAYFRIDTFGDMLDCLAQWYPIVFGTSLFDSFNDVGLDGVVKMPQKDEAMIGGHCMLIIGYSMSRKSFFVRNSWGRSWGYNGHCWIPFDYIEKYADDFWTIRKMS